MISRRRPFLALPLSVCLLLFGIIGSVASTWAAGSAKKGSSVDNTAIDTAVAFASAISRGDRIGFGRLDFACQYRLVTAASTGLTTAPSTQDPSYDDCWREMTERHAHTLTRTDVGMDILWPSAGPLAFFGDDMLDLPSSAFVMDAIGVSPPGSGLRLTVTNSRRIPDGSFRLAPRGKVVGVPATLVDVTVHYQDPLTAPVAYTPGTAHWTSTVKRPRRALKSITTRWVVFSGLKKYGFHGNAAVFLHPVPTEPEAAGMRAEKIPFATETSRALAGSLVWWESNDQPGTLSAATARAATFPELRDRVALLNRILLIDPLHVDALTVLTRHLYAMLLRDAADRHRLNVRDQALSVTVNEFYWNINAVTARLDLSNNMEMGGFSQPTPADFLYRMLPAMETLAHARPEQLDNRFRLGIAYRWNNDQSPMIQTFESLLRDIPEQRKTPRAETLLQLAWSRINKVAWNRILHDPDSLRAYADAEASLVLAEQPLDKFLAEYTMAYSMMFMPDYGDKTKMLQHLTEAKHWFDQVPGKDDAVWRYFLETERLKAVLDADPLFRTILASTGEEQK